MRSCPVVVIGHVDHGKTALVRALSGMETDRLAEERRRGLSIVAGYAFCAYPEGVVDLIDAPGHADFIRAMVAAAAGARRTLLVVSLTEGVAAQTLEHLRIARCLGLETGLVALSRADLCPPPERAARRAAIAAALAGAGWTGGQMLECSARSGEGIEALHGLLRAGLEELPAAQAGPGPILPVDRVFAARGHGTVVTGTLIGAGLGLGDSLTLWPTGTAVSLRAIQSRGEPRDRVGAGERVALNLRGIAAGEIGSGALLAGIGAGGATTMTGAGGATTRIDIRLDLAPGVTGGLRHMQEIRVHFGSACATAKLVLLGQREVAPGQGAHAQLRFARPVGAYRGQPALLRGTTPEPTLAGARFLDIAASPPRSGGARRRAVLAAAERGDLAELAAGLCAEGRGRGTLDDLARLSGVSPEALGGRLGAGFRLLSGGACFAPAAEVADCEAAILSALAAYHRAHRLKQAAPSAAILPPGVARALRGDVLAGLAREGRVRLTPEGAALAGHDPQALLTGAEAARLAEIEHRFERAGTRPPARGDVGADETDADLIAMLLQSGRLVALENVALRQSLLFHVRALGKAAERLAAAFPPPRDFTTSQARAALDTSRKFIVPLLEQFDRQGLTRRAGDLRQFRAPEGR